jgi:two-component system response regulator PilR (NtrC family)
LRERSGDVRLLAEAFLDRHRKELGRPGLAFTEEALKLLERYAFPGNVRQLQNMVERAAALADGDALGPDSLPSTLRGVSEEEASDETQAVSLPPKFSLERFLDSSERRYLLEALEKADGVKMRAAELLGLSFRSFRYRLAKHGLSTKDDE